MITILLHGAEFFAYHGFYPEEQILGCKFIVDAEVSFNPADRLQNDEIADTVDYEKLHRIIDEEMKLTKKLIETVAQAIINTIKIQFTGIDEVKVTIKKINPPLQGKVAYAGIVLT